MAMFVCYDTGTVKGEVMNNWRPDGAPTLNALRMFIKARYKKYELQWFELQYKYDDKKMVDIKQDLDLTGPLGEKRTLKQDFIIYVTKIVNEDQIKTLEEKEKKTREKNQNLIEEYATKQIDDEKKENKPLKRKIKIKNPLIVNIGISEYQNKKLSKLSRCRKDVETMNNVFVNEYKYDSKMIMHNNHKDKYGLTKSEILYTITTARDTIKKAQNVDGLIISLSGHGSAYTIYGADYDGKDAGKINVKDIEDKIFDEKDEEFNFADIPKIVIMDSYHKQAINESITEPSLKNTNWLCFYSSSHGYNSTKFDHKDGGFLITAVSEILKNKQCYLEAEDTGKVQYSWYKLKMKIRGAAFKLTKDENFKKKKIKPKDIVIIQDQMDKNVDVTFNRPDPPLITQIDEALSRYYQSLNKEYDELFQNYCEDNGIDTDTVLEELGNNDAANSVLVDFDDDFPFIAAPESREQAIFEVILKCKNNPKILFDATISSRNVTSDEKIESQKIEEQKSGKWSLDKTYITNPVIVNIGISKYNNEKYFDLDDCKKDIVTMNTLWKQYGYECIYHNKETPDLTAEAFWILMTDARTEFINKSNKHDAFIISFSGHGDSEHMWFSDYNDHKGKVNINQMQEFIAYPHILDKALLNCPRIAIIDACRDKALANKKLKGPGGIHKMANWVSLYSNAAGYKSKNTLEGGCLIRACFDILTDKQANQTKWSDLTKIIKMKVNEKSNDTQCAEPVGQFTKDVYFKALGKGKHVDVAYDELKWNVTVIMNGITSEYTDTKINCDYDNKKIIFKCDNENEIVLMKNEFSVTEIGDIVDIKYVSNENSIKINCHAIKPAHYWCNRFKKLSNK